MGRILAARDWSAHALGAPESWPSGLLAAVQMGLASHQPMFVWWGAGFHQFYNDACLRMLGDRHPACLAADARQACPDLWEALGPSVRDTLGGQRTIATACPQPGRPVRFVCRPLAGANGCCAGVVAICSEPADLGDQAAAQRAHSELRDSEARHWQVAAALEDADRRKDEFLATLAHELRNPLAPLRNALYLLQLQELSAGTRAIHAIMDRQVRQLVRLVDDLLDLSRVTRGKIDLQRRVVELTSVVETAVEASRPLLDAAQHSFAVTLPAEPVYVDADATRLAQVFTNLLNNAAKFTDAGGRVWLAAERSGDEVVVTVGDNGIGIPPLLLTAVFDMFRQVEAPPGNQCGGLGIGLTLVKRLVQMHGGSVEAYSEGIGRGSRFVVRLPVAQGPLADPRAGARMTGGETGAGRPLRRILVVDDNADAAHSLALLLRRLGHDVRVAYDGESGLSAALAYQPHLVFLDLGLPGLSGHEVAERLRARFEPGQMRLVAMTGYGHPKDRLRSTAAGFDRHLVKPVDWPAIEATLEA